MNLRELTDASVAVSLFRYLNKGYSKIEQKLIDIYCNSQTHKLTKSFWEKVKICSRFSFLGRITEARQRPFAVLDNSRVMQYLISFYKKHKQKLVHYSKSSLLANVAKDTKEELKFSPARILGIIIITAVAINMLLSLVLQRQISLWGWLMRGLFLLTGASGLFCKADWPAVKKGSILLRKMPMD